MYPDYKSPLPSGVVSLHMFRLARLKERVEIENKQADNYLFSLGKRTWLVLKSLKRHLCSKSEDENAHFSSI